VDAWEEPSNADRAESRKGDADVETQNCEGGSSYEKENFRGEGGGCSRVEGDGWRKENLKKKCGLVTGVGAGRPFEESRPCGREKRKKRAASKERVGQPRRPPSE